MTPKASKACNFRKKMKKLSSKISSTSVIHKHDEKRLKFNKELCNKILDNYITEHPGPACKCTECKQLRYNAALDNFNAKYPIDLGINQHAMDSIFKITTINGEAYGVKPRFEKISKWDKFVDFIIPDSIAKWFEEFKLF